jgi:hypothetical protein
MSWHGLLQENLSLDKMLDIFKASHTHLFFVQPPDVFANGELDEERLKELTDVDRNTTFKRSVSTEMERRKDDHRSNGNQEELNDVSGIITMEDVLEELIQAEIVDETDQYEDNLLDKKVLRGTKEISEMEVRIAANCIAIRCEHARVYSIHVDNVSQEREAFFRAMVGSKGYKEKTLSEEETNAVVSFLCLHVEPFRAVTDLAVLNGRICDGGDGTVTLARVREMLAICRVEELDSDGKILLPTYPVALIYTGAIRSVGGSTICRREADWLKCCLRCVVL